MMDTKEFLQLVLPPEGHYVSTEIFASKATKNRFHNTIDELVAAVQKSDLSGDLDGRNIYYAIGSYKTPIGGRTQENVGRIQSLILDIDAGSRKKYKNWKEGLLALQEFVDSLNLPKPMVVHSGNGLHVYWVLDAAVDEPQWASLAEALKSATNFHGLKADAGLTANSAVVLRPIGTHNRKNDNEVKCLIKGVRTSYAEMQARLGKFMAAPSGARVKARSALAKAMDVSYDLPPAVPAEVVRKCQHVRWAVENQDLVEEPLWYAVLGVAAYCENPEETAIAWSQDHHGFDADQTVDKMYQWTKSATGPTTCERFMGINASGCNGCPYAGKLSTPVRLGVVHEEVDTTAEAPDVAAVEVPLPKVFKRTATGIVMEIDGVESEICPFDIYPVSYGADESLGYEVVVYAWNRRHVGWTPLVMRQALLNSGSLKDFGTICADQGIVLHSDKQLALFQLMLRTYMDQLREMQTVTNLHSTMGWKDGHTQFILGDTIIRKSSDGVVRQESTSLSQSALSMGNDLWETAGSQTAWVDFTRMLDKANMHPHMLALGISLSAPLYAFTGLNGLTISLYGPTGGGKTLAQYWQQSIWGNPERLHFASEFTLNSLFSRMGTYCHMPMTIDEATMVADKDVGRFLYWVTQGRDRARLNRSAQERSAKTWALPVTISTNRSWQSKLIASGLDTDAQAARLLELSVPVNRVFEANPDIGRKIFQFLHKNYGHVGRTFVAKLIELGPDAVKDRIAQATNQFPKKYGSTFTGSERFWEQALVLADLALDMAHKWGLIKFSYQDGISWALEQLGAIRKTMDDSRMDAFDILSTYMSEFADAQVQVIHIPDRRPTMNSEYIPRNGIRVRYDFYRKNVGGPIIRGTVTLDRTHFRTWLSSRGNDYKTFMDAINSAGINVTPSHAKAYMGRNTPLKLGQVYAIVLNLDHPRTQGILSDADLPTTSDKIVSLVNPTQQTA